MPKIIFISHDGTKFDTHAEVGQTAMQVAVNSSVPGIIGECGGMCSCATCHGYVDPEWAGRLAPPSRDELDMLQCALEPRENSRLCCQLALTEAHDGLTIRLPKSQL